MLFFGCVAPKSEVNNSTIAQKSNQTQKNTENPSVAQKTNPVQTPQAQKNANPTIQNQKDMESVHKTFLKFKNSIYTDNACRRLVGIDNNKCVNYETCQKACYSSTPFCLPIALDEGKSFIYDVWKYENLTAAFNDSVEYEQVAYEAAYLDISKKAAYSQALQGVFDAQNNLIAHRFYGLICAVPQYDNDALRESISDINSLAN